MNLTYRHQSILQWKLKQKKQAFLIPFFLPLLLIIMFSNKLTHKISTTRSNKKTVRLLQTQADEHIPNRKSELSNRASQRQQSKQKYLDVYSKLNLKDTANQRKTFKTNTQKQPLRFLKTEPDEPKKPNLESSLHSYNKYQIDGVAGKGTFGTVFLGHVRGTGEKVAIKRVLQDKRYKNRQLQILRILKNQNVLEMRDYFINYEADKQYLNVVMNYFPYNLYQVIKKKQMNPNLIKILFFQILKGLNYLTTLSIAHRDIKPQNILVDLAKNKAVICDFGSAKQLVTGQPNLAYICSRCYRAPQLIFGATDYNPQIDMWSTGCVLVQMINGQPPFLGDSQIDQLIQIIKILGTPTKQQVLDMNKTYDMKQYSKFPSVKTVDWKSVLNTKDPILVDLVTKMLQYSPKRRLTPAEAIMHSYFDQLRNEHQYKELVIKYKFIPDLFQFSKEQLKKFSDPHAVIPDWIQSKHSYGVNLNLGSISVKRPVNRLV